MTEAPLLEAGSARTGAAMGVLLLGQALAFAADWPHNRGPTTDGISPDLIAAAWATNSPGFVVWTNGSLTNGFSSFAVIQGWAFALISRDDGSGSLREFCVAVDAATGTNIWATPIDDAPWDPAVDYNGGDGSAPYNTGDGPRTTPSVKDGRVIAFSGLMHLVCLNLTNGSVLWSNDLPSAYGASTITWENAASPCLDDDLIFVNLNTSSNNKNLAAFRTADGSLAWSAENENVTHATPVVATLPPRAGTAPPSATDGSTPGAPGKAFAWIK
jgi:outer membrane protein assembly factor BamB